MTQADRVDITRMALGDVQHGAEGAQGPAVGCAVGLAAALHPLDAAVGHAQAVLEAVGLACLEQVPIGVGELRPVLGVDRGKQRGAGTVRRRAIHLEQAPQFVGQRKRAAGQVEFPRADPRDGLRRAQLRLAPRQCLLGLAPARDVDADAHNDATPALGIEQHAVGPFDQASVAAAADPLVRVLAHLPGRRGGHGPLECLRPHRWCRLRRQEGLPGQAAEHLLGTQAAHALALAVEADDAPVFVEHDDERTGVVDDPFGEAVLLVARAGSGQVRSDVDERRERALRRG